MYQLNRYYLKKTVVRSRCRCVLPNNRLGFCFQLLPCRIRAVRFRRRADRKHAVHQGPPSFCFRQTGSKLLANVALLLVDPVVRGLVVSLSSASSWRLLMCTTEDATGLVESDESKRYDGPL